MLGLPPGVHFRPDDDELVEFYLLPRARGEPAPFPAGVVVVDDDAAGCTLPWELLDRHGRSADDEAYFLVRSSGDGDSQEKRGARQERGFGGGGTWKSQKRLAHGGSHYYIFYFQRRTFFIFKDVFWKRLRAIISVNTPFSEVFSCTRQLIK